MDSLSSYKRANDRGHKQNNAGRECKVVDCTSGYMYVLRAEKSGKIEID